MLCTMIDEEYAVEMSILYTNVTTIHHQILSKKDTICKIDGSNLSVLSWHGLLLLFFDKPDDLANKNDEFYNTTIKKVLATINDMPHQFSAGKAAFYKEHYNVTWEEFLMAKFGVWICIFALTTCCGSEVEKISISLQTKK